MRLPDSLRTELRNTHPQPGGLHIRPGVDMCCYVPNEAQANWLHMVSAQQTTHKVGPDHAGSALEQVTGPLPQQSIWGPRSTPGFAGPHAACLDDGSPLAKLLPPKLMGSF